MTKAKKTIFLSIILALIPLTVFADTESFYNSRQVYFYNEKDNCINQDFILRQNNSIGENFGGGLSKKIMKINNPNKFAKAIDIWIEQNAPNSPLKNHGKYAVAGGQKTGINPILPIIIAKKESSLATIGQISKLGNNAYGRTATSSQPHIGTSRLWYKWNSFQKSLVGQDNIYSYLKEVYQNQNTIEELMLKYAPPAENNTTLYISQIKKWANQIYDLAGDSIELDKIGDSVDYNYSNCQNNYGNFNSIDNLITFYQYKQPWKDHIFTSSCGNIKQCGCGPTSLAIALRNLTNNSSINPITISDQMNGMKVSSGTSWSAFTKIPQKYGLKSQNIGTNLHQAKNAINQGKMVIMSQGPGKFTNGGHIMVIRGFTPEGNVLVADPFSEKYTTNQNGFAPIVVAKSLKGMWAIGN